MADELSTWVDRFPAEDVEQEIEALLGEIDKLKEQVRRRREVLKIWKALTDGSGPTADEAVAAAKRHVASTRTKGGGK